jgi:hypothetical protein
MRKAILSSFLVVIMLQALMVNAQQTIRLPYSRFGLGQLQSQDPLAYRGMGGVSIGMRVPNQINFSNPASLTSQDTMSFLLDFGLSYNYTELQSSSASSTAQSGNFQNFSFAFPVFRWWYSGIGLLPYSLVGYHTQNQSYIEGTLYPYNIDYKGSGGLTRFVWSNAFKPFKGFSIGANVSYLFGSLDQTNTIDYLGVASNNSLPATDIMHKYIRVADVYMSYGLQYYSQKKEGLNYTIGLTFDNETKISARYDELFYSAKTYSGTSTYTSYDTIVNTKGSNSNIKLPSNLGVGVSLNYNNKLIWGADFRQQNWSNATILGKSDSLANSTSFHTGIQYTPNPRSVFNYFSRIEYRAGFHYTNSYYKFKGEQLKDIGYSAGLGFPFPSTRSKLNITYEFGKFGTTSNGLYAQKYSMFSVGFVLYDVWFVKRKFL